MIEELEDDTHYCLKCHSTINGLDNYVKHRKSDCGKTPTNVDDVVQTNESVSLKADDFFSSLELQRGAKIPHSNSAGGKSLVGVLTRSKCSATTSLGRGKSESNDGLESVNVSTKYQSRLLNYCESEEDTDDYDEDGTESEEDDYNIPPRSFTGGKWKPTSSPIQWTNHNMSIEERDWNAPPPNFTGGKWKLHVKSADDAGSHQEHSNGKWKLLSLKDCGEIPPPTFTGGKWSSAKNTLKTEKSKLKTPSFTSIDSKLSNQVYQTRTKSLTYKSSTKIYGQQKQNPSPSYTKGKWKPHSPNREKSPSPSCTKGKWKPIAPFHTSQSSRYVAETEISPFRKSNGAIQYWCGPCNRHLASKIVYERHLKSDFHNKRASSDADFEKPCFGLNRAKDNTEVNIMQNSDVTGLNVEGHPMKETSSRMRKKIYIICDGCQSKVHYKSIGKHLISYFHCSKSDISLPEAKRMVLEHIYNIVLQSPFQCAPCKFYCNSHDWFLKHWLSEGHKTIIMSNGSMFRCTICKYEAENNEVMHQHLVSEEHTEIISVINRSVPIIIKKITPIRCLTCTQQFLYNIQLRKHCEQASHTYSLESSDDYQNKYKCSSCDAVLKSKIALQRHEHSSHNNKQFICSVCSLNFKDIVEAKRHRNTVEHRYAVLEKKKKETTELDISRVCQYCSERCENVLKLKEHYKEKHPEHNSSCPYCGKSFTIPQDLSVHIRKRACVLEEDFTKSKSCDECQFKTDSTSELIFHKVLHGESTMIASEDGDETKTLPQYKCPMCDRFFVKQSLRCHLRLHTKERPFQCSLCSAGFVRRNNLVLHMKNHKQKQDRVSQKEQNKSVQGDRPFLCSTCGVGFNKRSILKQHMTRHVGKSIKCTYPECIFTARFPAELKTHLQIHSDKKSYSCDRCSYQGKTKQQLNRHATIHEETKKYSCSMCNFTSRLASHIKRHMHKHTGAKPFLCPHCHYSCNNLENLRKHVLMTNRHPGKCLYECKYCQDKTFETNFAKDFKVHLVTAHPENFESGKEAGTYISGICQANTDQISTPEFSRTEEQNGDSHKKLLGKDATLSSQYQDTIQTSATANTIMGPAALLTSVTIQDSSENKMQDELFPMLIVSKNVICIENPSESWNIGGSYDVEESSGLVPFQSVGETLFHEHFQ